MFHNFDEFHSSKGSLTPHNQLSKISLTQPKYPSIDVTVHYSLQNEKKYLPPVPAEFNEEGDLNSTALIEHLKSEGLPKRIMRSSTIVNLWIFTSNVEKSHSHRDLW